MTFLTTTSPYWAGEADDAALDGMGRAIASTARRVVGMNFGAARIRLSMSRPSPRSAVFEASVLGNRVAAPELFHNLPCQVNPFGNRKHLSIIRAVTRTMGSQLSSDGVICGAKNCKGIAGKSQRQSRPGLEVNVGRNRSRAMRFLVSVLLPLPSRNRGQYVRMKG